jgi:hypothetical protein
MINRFQKRNPAISFSDALDVVSNRLTRGNFRADCSKNTSIRPIFLYSTDQKPFAIELSKLPRVPIFEKKRGMRGMLNSRWNQNQRFDFPKLICSKTYLEFILSLKQSVDKKKMFAHCVSGSTPDPTNGNI